MTYTFSIVNELFGKPAENLSCSDIKALVESGVPESLRLEFKAVPEDNAERKLIEITIKSIVEFLNSDIGRGLTKLYRALYLFSFMYIAIHKATINYVRDEKVIISRKSDFRKCKSPMR